MPGMTRLPLLGNLLDLRADPAGFWLRLQQECTKAGVEAAQADFGTLQVLYIFSPRHVAHVLQDSANIYTKSDIDRRALGLLIGNGLILNEGESHRKRRRLLMPCFTTERLDGFVEDMVTVAEQSVQRLLALQQRQQQHGAAAEGSGIVLDIHAESSRYTLSVIGRCGFSTDIGDAASVVGAALEVCLHFATESARNPLHLPAWVPTPQNVRYLKSRQVLDSIVFGIIASRRQQQQAILPATSPPQPDARAEHGPATSTSHSTPTPHGPMHGCPFSPPSPADGYPASSSDRTAASAPGTGLPSGLPRAAANAPTSPTGGARVEVQGAAAAALSSDPADQPGCPAAVPAPGPGMPPPTQPPVHLDATLDRQDAGSPVSATAAERGCPMPGSVQQTTPPLQPQLQPDPGPQTHSAAEQQPLAQTLAQATQVRPAQRDVLDLLLEARYDDGSGLEDVELRDEVMTMVIAGHETSANVLAWAMYELARNPECAAMAVEEVLAVCGQQGRIQPHHLQRLGYVEAVLLETLRLYPAVWAFDRQASTEDELPGGIQVTQGSYILVAPWAAHRQPAVFPEPEAFRPGRFLSGSPEEIKPPRFAFIPFGGGARSCIGSAFAMLEMKVLLASWLRVWPRLDVHASAEPVLADASITYRPLKALTLRMSQ